jgi:hypothetical protein
MHEKGMKGLMVMIIFLATLVLVLKHVELHPLPFFAPHIPPSLHPLSVPARLLSFSLDEDGIRRWKTSRKERSEKLKLCYRNCREYFYENVKHEGPGPAWKKLKNCREQCKDIHGR